MYARRSPRARSASAGFNFSTKILAQGKEATTPSIPPPATYPLAALSRDRGEGGCGLDRWEIKGNARRNLFNQELVDRLSFNDLTGFSGVIDRDRDPRFVSLYRLWDPRRMIFNTCLLTSVEKKMRGRGKDSTVIWSYICTMNFIINMRMLR